MDLNVSIAQMHIQLGDAKANLDTVAGLAAEAARRGSDLLVLPELWSTGYDLDQAETYATSTSEGVFKEVALLARELGLAIVGSTLSRLANGGVGNTAVFFDKQGANRGEYHKIHLFGGMGEDRKLVGGQRPCLIETPWGNMGLAICYDLRFPELFRAYALKNAKLVILPAEWPRPRLAHWQTLLRARSIENQMFLVACNRVGHDGSAEFFGHSAIIDPCGEIIIEAGEHPALLTASIDLDEVERVRAGMPVLADRRPRAYE